MDGDIKHPEQSGRSTLEAASLAAVRKGLFVSDLHLFSPRSVGEKVVTQFSTLSQDCDCLVLGGDIFDFRWSDHGSHLATLDAARRWLLDLLHVTGEIPIVFLPGNHDSHPEFLAMLDALAAGEPRLTWAAHHLQIADCLFLHGDLLDAGSVSRLEAYRSKFHHESPQSRLAHRSYDLAVSMRIHKLIPRLRHKPLQTCQRLLDAMPELWLPSTVPVQQIYFGHTHVAIHGLEVNGIKFFNPGAALRHMDTHIHPFAVTCLDPN